MIYNQQYYDNMLKNYSGTAEYICRKRWEFVGQVNPKLVLDFGCGVGWFRAFAPADVKVDTYDVMPVMQTGIQHDHYDLVTFWDSMEHMTAGYVRNALLLGDAVALTVPICPDGVDIRNWRHFKPGEHLWYPSREEVVEVIEHHGFKVVEFGQVECPPRTDVWSFLFERDDAKKTDTCERTEPWGYSTVDCSNPGLAHEFPRRVCNGCKDTVP